MWQAWAFRTAPQPITIVLVPETMLREDEPRLVDNPFRRESHRPWYARRGPRWGVGILVILLLALNAFAFKEVSNRADPVTVDTAIARYRATAQVAADSTPSTTAAGATPAVAADADAQAPGQARTSAGQQQATETAGPAGEVGVGRGPTPAPGVYVFDTIGFERVSALGGAQHDYPKQTTMTVTKSECGVDARWTPLEQRFERWTMCMTGTANEMAKFTTHHEFFGKTEERTFDCRDTYIRPPSDAPGTTANGGCTNGNDVAVTSTTVIGPETVLVQGSPVDTVRMHFDHQLSGSSNGYQRGDVWVRLSDGMLVRFISEIDADANSVIGPTHFHEEINLSLAELEPHQ
ncbi:MAG: hypothetical protein QOI95_2139 [Acidimicrobiaceae bacterium]|jgi:hypothetical protein